MQVLLADSYGMCFGVRDAVQMALDSPHRSELTILGELVHNPQVLRRLSEAGVRTVPSVDAPVETPRVMITAHGAADSVVESLRARGLEVEEATCPLVAHAHRSLRRLVAQGYFPVVIGNPDHVEVRGLVGDLEQYAVIPGPEAVPQLAGRSRLGVVSQTTQPLDFVREMVDRIRTTFPEAEVRFADTVCQPTKERQEAARRLASSCDVVIVIGGRSSNNTRQLVRACQAEGARAYQVEAAADLRPDWFDGVETVGLTAGTSTPDEVIEEVHRALVQLATERASVLRKKPVPFRHVLTYDTTAKSEIRTITAELNDLVARSGIADGTLMVYSLHTTLGLIVQETSEPNLCRDFVEFLTGLVEDDGHRYHHTCALHPSGACVEDRFNAPSHVRQILTNQSVVLDVHDGRISFGRWQDVAFLELDGPRPGRRILVKIMPD